MHTDDKGMKSVAYAHMTAVLVEAIKEQQSIIENQAEALRDIQQDLYSLKSHFESTGGLK